MATVSAARAPMGMNRAFALSVDSSEPSLQFRLAGALGIGSAANAVPLPKPKPRAVCEHFIVPSIQSRDVACTQRPDIRCLKHFFQLFDVVNGAFNVHSVPNIQHSRGNRQRGRHLWLCSNTPKSDTLSA